MTKNGRDANRISPVFSIFQFYILFFQFLYFYFSIFLRFRLAFSKVAFDRQKRTRPRSRFRSFYLASFFIKPVAILHEACYNKTVAARRRQNEYGGVLKRSKRRDSKSRRPLTRRVGSNPTSSASAGTARCLFALAAELLRRSHSAWRGVARSRFGQKSGKI